MPVPQAELALRAKARTARPTYNCPRKIRKTRKDYVVGYFVPFVEKDISKLENKAEAQIKIIRQTAFFRREITVIGLNYDIGDRLVLQAKLVNLFVFG